MADSLAHEMWRAVLTAVACARAWLGLGLVLLEFKPGGWLRILRMLRKS